MIDMKVVCSRELRIALSEVLSKVFYNSEKYTITRNGKQLAVIISIDLWEEIQKTQCKTD